MVWFQVFYRLRYSSLFDFQTLVLLKHAPNMIYKSYSV